MRPLLPLAARRLRPQARLASSSVGTDSAVYIRTYLDVPGERIGEIATLTNPLYRRTREEEGLRGYSFCFAQESVNARRTVLLRETYVDAAAAVRHYERKNDLLDKTARHSRVDHREVIAPPDALEELSSLDSPETRFWQMEGGAIARQTSGSHGPDVTTTIAPYFEVDAGMEWKFFEHCAEFYSRVRNEEKFLNYGFCTHLVGDTLHAFCNETYRTKEGALEHLRNVDGPLKTLLGMSKLVRLEVHCPAVDEPKLHEALEELGPLFYFLDGRGIRK
eukprot:TRINITY_DN26853_c0_g1_i1.p1 TRINITY_DN26853_c0_g1~~TRINITY_DN26853_c0_g1_i1.p1  ORF type:complete len:277 (+),score=88.74 TRINITY_DN26853_c0_g1_i1:72-902(+)